MTNITFRLSLLFLCLLAVAVRAQDDPFGAGPAPAQPAPGAKPPADDKKKSTETDDFVLTLRRSNPTTPSQLGKAVQIMANYGRPDEVRRYLQALIALNLDEQGLMQLNREAGTGLLFRMMRDEQYHPEGPQIAQAVFDAVNAFYRDPVRLDRWIHELSDPSEGIRVAAITALKQAGSYAVSPMISAIADPARAKEHPSIRDGMVRLGEVTFAEPLVGTLDAPDVGLKINAMDVLGRLRYARAISHLVEPVTSDQPELAKAAKQAIQRIFNRIPTRQEAEAFLLRRAQNYFDGNPVAEPDFEDMIGFWTWDEQEKKAVLKRYPYRDAGMIEAGRLASALYRINPKNVDYRRLYLVSLLESAKIVAGLDQPLPRGKGTAFQLAGDLGADALEDALVFGMKSKHIPGVAAIVEVLGAAGNESLLQSTSGEPRPLVQATRHADRRLRFRATMAILEINPQQSFAGASYVVDALGYFAGSLGSQRVLLGHPKLSEGHSLVAMAAELGFEADTAQTGRQLFLRAVQNPDYECILLTDTIAGPRSGEVIQSLRRDPRTAKIPIGLISRGDDLEKSQRLAAQYAFVSAFPQPIDTTDTARELRDLFQLPGRDFIPREERLMQATAALEALGRMFESPGQFPFDIARHEASVITASGTPELSLAATRVLGLIATPKVQQTLVDLASQDARPLDIRQAAAEALMVAVQRKGVKLTSPVILRQYAIYNQSEKQSDESRKVLAAILDAIEFPSKQAAAAAKAERGEAAP